ncbi:hypothetical protein EB796_024278 [Bugula neritina]|uniref:Uncharacterized protein n=1 Tax=Bugula neritina TaxID=10212 RepID=A0A7J7IUC4_BUGNE|nr:hypothetical protein EB796_024278 [Bugula neritina]
MLFVFYSLKNDVSYGMEAWIGLTDYETEGVFADRNGDVPPYEGILFFYGNYSKFKTTFENLYIASQFTAWHWHFHFIPL